MFGRAEKECELSRWLVGVRRNMRESATLAASDATDAWRPAVGETRYRGPRGKLERKGSRLSRSMGGHENMPVAPVLRNRGMVPFPRPPGANTLYRSGTC